MSKKTAHAVANEQANTLRAQADALVAELADESKALTPDEVKSKTDGIRSLRQRAAALVEFTPEEEIKRQGGDADPAVVRVEPGKEVDQPPEYDALCKQVRSAFGGPNGYLLAVARDGAPRAKQMNDRQRAVHQAMQDFQKRTIIGDASDATGGEFLLPLQQVQSIFTADLEQPGLAERASRYAVTGRTLRIPILDQYDAANTRPMAGIAAITIVGEGAEKPEREPQFLQRLLTVYKWAAYTELGDEVLADDMTGELAPTIQRAVGGQIMNEINGYVTYDGNGTGQPLGAINSSNAAMYTVNRATSQNIAVADVYEMDARFVDGAGSFWIASPSTKPEIYALAQSNNTMVTWITDLRSRPVPMLLGRPIIWTHLAPLLGVRGDLALINPAFVAFALRAALTVESSIHYRFRNDITAYRFFARAGSIPIPTGTYSYKSSGAAKTYEVSPFVALGDATSS